MDSDTRKTIIEIVLISVVVLAGTIGSGFLPWYVVVGGLATACIVYFTIMCTRCQGKILKIEQMLKKKLGQVKGLQDIYTGQMTILDTDEIIAIERAVTKEIWIATYDLSYDLSQFIETGKYNLERGVTYKYFIPRKLEPEFQELVNKHNELGTKKDSLKSMVAVYVNSEYIPFNVVLYDPQSQKHGFIYVPKEKTNFFIKFDRQSFSQVRNYFHFLLSKKEDRSK